MLRPMLFLLLSLLLLLSGCKVEMYSGLSEDQANQMLSTLLRRGIEAEKQAAGKNGYTLLVDDDQLVRALQVLKENSLPREAFKNLGEVFAGDGSRQNRSCQDTRRSRLRGARDHRPRRAPRALLPAGEGDHPGASRPVRERHSLRTKCPERHGGEQDRSG